MATYELTVKQVENVAKDTLAVSFEKPEGFTFRPGQMGDFTLLSGDQKGETHAFSLVSAPSEDELKITTRLTGSDYKKALQQLSAGDQVEADIPNGHFTLHKKEHKPAVFLIGGIGITPIRSMIAEATHQQTDHPLTLLYANRTAEDAAYLEDLQNFAAENDNFTFVPVMTQGDGVGDQKETGHIDETMLKRYVTDLEAPTYYLSGPAGMVNAMYDMLITAGADEDDIKAEDFPGY